MCGEKHLKNSLASKASGSPPRVRGKVVLHSCVLLYVRITPACAGKRNMYAKRWCWRMDHPRVCGEKRWAASCAGDHPGSPPRVRGKADAEAGGLPLKGITPACAGKSPCTTTATTPHRDHPRVCGEKKASGVSASRSSGSPPRVRGKDEGKKEIARTLRITPACAGKSGSRYREQIRALDHPRVCGEK